MERGGLLGEERLSSSTGKSFDPVMSRVFSRECSRKRDEAKAVSVQSEFHAVSCHLFFFLSSSERKEKSDSFIQLTKEPRDGRFHFWLSLG